MIGALDADVSRVGTTATRAILEEFERRVQTGEGVHAARIDTDGC